MIYAIIAIVFIIAARGAYHDYMDAQKHDGI